ncbi:MAG TPA: TldD/PmbA family protein [Firmicutes bacterium]|nr:TldD/PmbA family protein [Bacillota bacterium]
MFNFPDGLYVDVRIEKSFETKISFREKALQEQKARTKRGAFIRVYDGKRWYYISTTDLARIQDHIDSLAEMAVPNARIGEDPIVQSLEVHRQDLRRFEEESVTVVAIAEKQALLEKFIDLIADPAVVNHNSYYVDKKMVKSFYSSKGSAITFDWQSCGIRLNLDIAHGDQKDQMVVSKGAEFFGELPAYLSFFKKEIEKNIAFVKEAKPVEPGDYTVLLSPEATGIFTHESFGHKSESDFMVGDETMKKEWALGKRVGKDLLTIIDDGGVFGSGFTPFDDEGTKSKKTKIISQGKLTGRLHSAGTATALEEGLTGNARAINFEFEPIVRMTTTYIAKGSRPLAEIIGEMEKGIYLDTLKHGSGMSTFTLAPARAYKIENGKITEPVKISVVTGNVFTTLDLVDAVSSEFELASFVGGGCGKMEQAPLSIGFGGPYTRVQKLKVQ